MVSSVLCQSLFKVQVPSHLGSLSYISLPSETQNCLNISDSDHFSCFCLLRGWILQVWDLTVADAMLCRCYTTELPGKPSCDHHHVGLLTLPTGLL
uniref:Uncharacterized protein n=1 Tax=Bos indicus x Bos taurus TaxID=30522 RepID=A0A4W2IG10_BOBOX